MATSSSGIRDVVVWEWQEDNGQWIPYSPAICQQIEKEHRSGNSTRFMIQVSMQLLHKSNYEIDLVLKTQTNQYTRSVRQIQRNLQPSSSALAQGICWEWCKQSRKGQKHWTPYSVEANEEIERRYSNREPKFKFPANYNIPYEVNFKDKSQVNFYTNYKRAIRREQITGRYPPDTTNALLNGTVLSNSGIPGTTYPHNPITTSTTGMGQWSISSSVYYPHTPSSGLAPQYSSGYNVGQGSHSSANPGSNYPPLHQPGYVNMGNSSSTISNYNARSKIVSNLPAATPAPSTAAKQTTSTTTGASSSGTKKKKRTIAHVPTCPAGGIPCNAAASTGTVPVAQVLKNFTKKIDVDANSTDHCAICQSKLTENSGFGNSSEACELKLCKHVFHCECLEASYSHGVKNGCIVCSTCNKMHGIKTGNQPDGFMRYSKMSTSLPGHPGSGTLQVEYHIQPGVQKAEHPHPGKHYNTPGFPRIGYIPDNNEGRRVLLLLIEAWKRRLIFTVGQSSTSGRDDCVTWTGIHHKTEMQSNRGHGYPDDTYLDRVVAELEAEGVTDDA